MKKTFAFIGSYADSKNSGVYVCAYNEQTGTLELVDEAAGLQNPTFLDVDLLKMKLYALTEGVDANQQRCGAAAAFDIDPGTGQLSLLNKETTVPATTCHISLDRTNRFVMVSSYHGGMVGMSPLLEDGRIGATSDIQRHHGASLLPVQDRARAHSVFVDRFNRFAGVCDLGLDRIITYRLDTEASKLIPHKEVQIAPGSGPRHFVFHPSYSYGYVINELNSTITAFSYDEEQGELSEIQTVSTLPDAFAGENACADIHVSPDGAYLYGSNRGHDSIVVFAIDPLNGKLAFVEHAPTLGKHPRNFAISPDGHFVLVANKDSDHIVSFAREPLTGKLLPTGSVLKLSMPVCIKFAVFE
ncbi:lactonase family protein [Paenibacillus sp. SI8]|uniref:lactonase family protein n=1 Tax=unclassified Paenibacillus TaxID=185978 RepID=UPI0034653D1F